MYDASKSQHAWCLHIRRYKAAVKKELLQKQQDKVQEQDQDLVPERQTSQSSNWNEIEQDAQRDALQETNEKKNYM